MSTSSTSITRPPVVPVSSAEALAEMFETFGNAENSQAEILSVNNAIKDALSDRLAKLGKAKELLIKMEGKFSSDGTDGNKNNQTIGGTGGVDPDDLGDLNDALGAADLPKLSDTSTKSDVSAESSADDTAINETNALSQKVTVGQQQSGGIIVTTNNDISAEDKALRDARNQSSNRW